MKQQIHFFLSILTFLTLFTSNPFTTVLEVNAGILPLYLNTGQTLSQTVPATNPESVSIGRGDTEKWTLTEPLAEAITLAAGIYMVQLYIDTNDMARNIRVSLTSTAMDGTSVPLGNVTSPNTSSGVTKMSFEIDLTQSVLIDQNSSIEMEIWNKQQGKPTGDQSITVHAVNSVLNYSKIDLVVVTPPMPDLTVVKSVLTYSDPVNNTTNPKAIPGAVVTYEIMVTNTGPVGVDNDSFVITDSLPANTELYFDPSTGPISFTDGAVSSNLTYEYLSPDSLTDDIEFFNGGGAYIPVPDASGYDENVTSFIINPKGIFNPYSGVSGLDPAPSCSASFKVRIK